MAIGCTAIILSADPVVSAAEPAARAIIDKAIEAAGGREALARYEKPFYYERKGTIFPGASKPPMRPFAPHEFTVRVTKWLPDKMRTDQESKPNGRISRSAFAIHGDKGWHKDERGAVGAGNLPPVHVKEYPSDHALMYRKRLYGDWVATLLPLDDDTFQLTTVDEITLDGRASVGIEVRREDHPTVRLYFDKETFAMTKFHYRSSDTAYLEELYDDYTDLDGLVYPRKVICYVKGVKTFEAVTTEFKFLDDVPDSTFDVP